MQKIRTVELDGKVIKLQIVSGLTQLVAPFVFIRVFLYQDFMPIATSNCDGPAVGYSRTGAFQNNH